MRHKHVPQRTCVACRQVRNKRELIRIVRTPAGEVETDESGKKSGRGAYLCRAAACWRLALKRGHLDRALKTSLTDEQRAGLNLVMESLPEKLAEGEKEPPPGGTPQDNGGP